MFHSLFFINGWMSLETIYTPASKQYVIEHEIKVEKKIVSKWMCLFLSPFHDNSDSTLIIHGLLPILTARINKLINSYEPGCELKRIILCRYIIVLIEYWWGERKKKEVIGWKFVHWFDRNQTWNYREIDKMLIFRGKAFQWPVKMARTVKKIILGTI